MENVFYKMMGVRGAELVSLLLFTLYSACYSINLNQLIHDRLDKIHADKREDKPVGNPCKELDKPFPCKGSDQCIPMAYICDNNYDCKSGYDETMELCAAANRPPVADIKKFLMVQSDWILPKVFPGKNIDDVAHALALSIDLDQFLERMHMSGRQSKGIRAILRSVMSNNPGLLRMFGMPPSQWVHVRALFKKLMNNGFQ